MFKYNLTLSKRWILDYTRRYLLLVCGLFIMAFGVAMSIIANMGITPISCLPYVLSQVNGAFSVGQFTAVMNIGFVFLQIFLLRRRYEPYQLLQIVLAIVLGILIDLSMMILSFLQPSTYLEQCILFALSTVVLSFGVFLEVKAGVLMVAGEGIVKAIAITTKIDFSKTKIISDCTLVAISAIIGMVYIHHVVGVREGTVIAALIVGLLLKLFDKHLHFVDHFLENP